MRTRAKVLGVLFMIAGLLLICNSVAFAQWSYQRSAPVMEDVVYLKDGSIIRGTIIEQIPNKSLKIKTADGNVFVYSLDKVLKITKEENRAPTGRQHTIPDTGCSKYQVCSICVTGLQF